MESKQLRRSFYNALIALLLTLTAIAGATFAWYIYNTSVHTTSVRMAAGTGGSLQISKTLDGTYSTSAVLDSFVGKLDPVSTNRIQEGFQKVTDFLDTRDEVTGEHKRIASVFDQATPTDYYETSLFLRTTEEKVMVYIADIGYEDSDEATPISSAIRVGFVVHKPEEKEGQPVLLSNGDSAYKEYIFAISDAKNEAGGGYNTATGREGYVLNAEGETVEFSPNTKQNYCEYIPDTGDVRELEHSVILCEISGSDETPTQVDVYIWLEGCDEDCRENLSAMTLKNVSVTFAARK